MRVGACMTSLSTDPDVLFSPLRYKKTSSMLCVTPRLTSPVQKNNPYVITVGKPEITPVGQWVPSRRRGIIAACADVASAGIGRPGVQV